MKKIFNIIIVINCIILLCSCKKSIRPISKTDFLMDTVVTITAYNGDKDAVSGAMKIVKKYDNMFSKTSKTGDVFKINNSNGKEVTVNNETAELIKLSIEISEKSNGAFDITILPLAELWDVNNADAVPDNEKINKTLKTVNYKNISIIDNKVKVINGAKIDLGGIAKGYIADKVKEYLISKNVTSAVINLGGNTLLIGGKDNSPFSVGIQKPWGDSGELAAIVELKDTSAVTSGTYQRYFTVGDKVYHHILDTVTGYPVDNNIDSVTVITDSSALADGLSTACLSLGIDKGKQLAEIYEADLVIIDKDGNLTVSENLEIDVDEITHIIFKE